MIISFKYCVNVENCVSFRCFSYIYIQTRLQVQILFILLSNKYSVKLVYYPTSQALSLLTNQVTSSNFIHFIIKQVQTYLQGTRLTYLYPLQKKIYKNNLFILLFKGITLFWLLFFDTQNIIKFLFLESLNNIVRRNAMFTTFSQQIISGRLLLVG